MSYYSTESAAGVPILTDVRQLLSSPKLETTDKLMEIVRPFASALTRFRPLLKE